MGVSARSPGRGVILAVALVAWFLPGQVSAAAWINYFPQGSLNPSQEVNGSYGSWQANEMYCYSPSYTARIRYRTTGGSFIRTISRTSCGTGQVVATGVHATESFVRPQCSNRSPNGYHTASCWALTS